MIQRNRLAILALVAAIALVGAGTGANAGPTAEIDRGSGITVAEHADALIAIEDNTITNHFPDSSVDVTVPAEDGELYKLDTGDSASIEVEEMKTMDIHVSGDATTAKIEDVEFEGEGKEEDENEEGETDIVDKWKNINAQLHFNDKLGDYDKVEVSEYEIDVEKGDKKVKLADDVKDELDCGSPSDTIDAEITFHPPDGNPFTEVVTGVECSN